MNIVDVIEVNDYSDYTITKEHYLGIIEYKRIAFDKVVGHWFEKNNLLHGEYKCWDDNGNLIVHQIYLEGKMINNCIKKDHVDIINEYSSFYSVRYNY